MVPVGDQTMLQHQIAALKNLEYSKILINTHHLATQIEEYVLELPQIHKVFHEVEILGTGGPLHRLYAEGYKDDLLVLNCDNYHDLPLGEFVNQSRSSGHGFSLLCTQNPQINSVAVADAEVVGVKNLYGSTGDSLWTFSGVAWYSAQALSQIKSTHFSIVRFWQEQFEQNNLPLAYCVNQGAWIDVGTPDGLYQANFNWLQKQQLSSFTAPDTINFGKTEQCILLHQCNIPQEAYLKECLVLANTNVKAGRYERSIIGDGFIWKI
jgi:MurNAc alpha-1-phosphate uridylyltransferase